MAYPASLYCLQDGDHLTNKRSPPFRPLSERTQFELELRAAKGLYEHFHVPWNTANRYLSSFNKPDLAACRDIARMPPPPFDKSGRSSMRPSTTDEAGKAALRAAAAEAAQQRPKSALPTKKQLVRERIKQMEVADAAKRLMMTQTGVPCFTSSELVPADLQEGAPLDRPLPERDVWRVSKVQTYALPPAKSGWGEGGVRPFHQDYRHYKYNGFAGQGAKTAWAYNPKHKALYLATAHSPSGAAEAAAAPAPSQSPQSQAQGPAKPGSTPRFMTPPAAFVTKIPPAEVMEPYMQRIDLMNNAPTPKGEPTQHRNSAAHVATYRQPVPSALTLSENPSPQHGSQAPFHQRYAHYKMHGFGGKGATSSWARNPKLSRLQ